MSILAAEQITFGYGESELISEISFSLGNGESIALMGANGSGKTTLSQILAGALKPWSGTVYCDDASPWDKQTYIDFRRRIGYVFQNPEDGFVASDVLREIAFAAENFGIPTDELKQNVESLLEQFGLEYFVSIPPLELSGGMKARLAIASALVTGADFLILDEPESFLDWKGRNIFCETLDEIKSSTGVLHVTQSVEIAEKCNKVFAIEDGKILELTDPKPFGFSLREIPDLNGITNHTDNNVLEFCNVEFAYDGASVLDETDFSIKHGEFIGLVGASGAGKTTLALLAAGLLKPTRGKVLRKVKTAIAFQFPERQLFAETVFDDVRYGPNNLGLKNCDEITRQTLELVGIEEKLWRQSPFELSDGQQRRVGLAGVIATKPELLIVDEPFASLDPEGVRLFFILMRELARIGTSVIVISHQTELLQRLVPRIIALAKGNIVFDGEISDLLGNTNLCQEIGIKSCSHENNV